MNKEPKKVLKFVQNVYYRIYFITGYIPLTPLYKTLLNCEICILQKMP